MNARIFSGALLLSAAIPVSHVDAQQAQRLYRVGVLNFGGAAPNVLSTPLNARLIERLAELGYREGNNLVLERRWADGKPDRLGPLTTELVQLKVDAMVTIGNKMLQAVQGANPRIPLVSLSCDSFLSVSNYARPNGNFTGVTCMSTELSPKRLEVAKLLVPDASRAVYLHNPNQGAIGLELSQKVAAQLGLALRAVEVRSPDGLPKAFASIAAERPDVLLVYPDALMMIHRQAISEFALAQKLPTVFAYKEFAEAGGLVSYGSTLTELSDRAAELVAKILRGAKPHELPIEQATRVYLTVNLKTARALGYAIPPSILQRADYVID